MKLLLLLYSRAHNVREARTTEEARTHRAFLARTAHVMFPARTAHAISPTGEAPGTSSGAPRHLPQRGKAFGWSALALDEESFGCHEGMLISLPPLGNVVNLRGKEGNGKKRKKK